MYELESHKAPLALDGVEIGVFVEGDVVFPQADGYLDSGKTDFRLRVDVPASLLKHGNMINVQGGDKKITIKKKNDFRGGYATFLQNVKFFYFKKDVLASRYDTNNMRWVSWENNHLTITEIGVVPRGLNSFLIVQKTHSGNLFRDKNGNIAIPRSQYYGFSEWRFLQTLLRDSIDVSALPDIDSFEDDIVTPDIPAASTRQGVVEFYNLCSGTGKVWVKYASEGREKIGLAHVYFASIKNKGRLEYLEKGQKIKYESIVAVGDNVQIFDVEAIGELC